MMMGLLKDIENMMHLGVLGEEFGPDSLLSDEEKQEAEAREQALFNNDLPPRPDCDICFNELPVASNQKTYKICCGKILCDGCIEEIRDKDDRKEKVGDLCPFCRTVATTSNTVELVKKRMEVNDPESFACMAHILMEGTYGQKRDEEKALSLMEKGAELGSLGARRHSDVVCLMGCVLAAMLSEQRWLTAKLLKVPQLQNHFHCYQV
jgi:hypothetical protein